MQKQTSILITGASSGIGRALALCYAKPGMTLFLSGRNHERLQQVSMQCQQAGAVVFAACVDVTDASAMQTWLLACDDQQPIDLLIANAGQSNYDAKFDVSIAQQIFDVNLQGVLNTVHPIIARMRQRKCGHIAMMSSLAGFQGMPHNPSYSAAKAAVRIYAEGLSGALQVDNICVSAICPGFIKTPMTDNSPYPTPFLLNVDKAADIIVQQLAQRKILVVFPWRFYALVYLGRLLPRALMRWFVSHVLRR